MVNDILVLGGLVFDDFSTPSRMPWGGSHALAIHKLPGGSRVIDKLGPDEADFTWNGFFWGADAFDRAKQLDAMRISGATVPLTWGGMAWNVIVSHAEPVMCRFPLYVHYSITVVVASAPMLGQLGQIPAGIDSLLAADIASAMAIAGL